VFRRTIEIRGIAAQNSSCSCQTISRSISGGGSPQISFKCLMASLPSVHSELTPGVPNSPIIISLEVLFMPFVRQTNSSNSASRPAMVLLLKNYLRDEKNAAMKPPFSRINRKSRSQKIAMMNRTSVTNRKRDGSSLGARWRPQHARFLD
jgi:hypothetical protein